MLGGEEVLSSPPRAPPSAWRAQQRASSCVSGPNQILSEGLAGHNR
jgi:hypothetical protein